MTSQNIQKCSMARTQTDNEGVEHDELGHKGLVCKGTVC